MIEHHTWITLVSQPDDEPFSAEVLKEIVASASRLGDAAQFKISVLNGLTMLHGCGAGNHPSPDRELLSDFCAHILELAPLSYGLLYFLDDEASDCFEVWVIRNGEIRKENDPFEIAAAAI